jgi:hypothetical protein
MANFDSIWTLLSDDEDDYPEEETFHYEGKYLLDYQWYHENFPEEWARCHTEGTGPGQCSNCADYGSVNGVFIGYCGNCAKYDYKGQRGRGFIDTGIENSDNDVLEYPSAFDSYLQGVDISTITEPGLQNINEDNTIINNYDNNNIIQNNDNINEYDEDDYVNADPYEDNTDTSVLNCHFEGGYNDF